jgi:hypothetical protein
MLRRGVARHERGMMRLALLHWQAECSSHTWEAMDRAAQVCSPLYQSTNDSFDQVCSPLYQ